MNNVKKDILSIKEFADEINVHPNTVRNMIKTGLLNCFRTGFGKTCSYRIPRMEINRMSEINNENIIENIVQKRLKQGI